MTFTGHQVRILISVFVMTIPILWGCMPDADRDNPFDPKIQIQGDTGQLSGRIIRIYPPFDGIDGCTVSLSDHGNEGRTDSDGYYLISDIPERQYTVIAGKPGFVPDTTTVEITAGAGTLHNASLDGLPFFLGSSITSEHTGNAPAEDQYFVNYEVQVDDLDGPSDIDSVLVTVEMFDFRRELNRVINTNTYTVQISPDEVGDGSLEALIGKESIFSVWDKLGNRTDSSSHFLIRILYPTPATFMPNEEDQMDDRQLLIWESFAGMVNFNFTYSVDVKSAFSTGWHRDNIPSDTTSIAVDEALDSQENHRWSIWVVDEFGNVSKSPYVTFSIEEGF